MFPKPVNFTTPNFTAREMESLTPSQVDVLSKIRLLNAFKGIIIKGGGGTGKHTIVKHFLEDKTYCVPDFFGFVSRLDHKVTGQDIIAFFGSVFTDPSSVFNQHLNTKTKYIYLRRFDKYTDILADYNSFNRMLFHHAFREWMEKIPDDFQIIITSLEGSLKSHISAWVLDYEVTQEDVKFLISKYLFGGSSHMDMDLCCDVTVSEPSPFHPPMMIGPKQIDEMSRVTKIQVPGVIVKCLMYSKAIGGDIIKNYKEALPKILGSNLDADKEVPKPEDGDLVGMDSILLQVQKAIINPIRLCNPFIPIKKGLIICGPPGTGKTSIGRYLAHEIKGKLFLIGGDAGVSGQSFIEALAATTEYASKTSPSVVFIDDGDALWDKDDAKRALLTTLDGIDSKARAGICFILTCNNKKEIPPALLRGGRFEMMIETSLPTMESRRHIIVKSIRSIAMALIAVTEGASQEHADMKTAQLRSEFTALERYVSETSKFNCADVKRLCNDVIRHLVQNTSCRINDAFEICLTEINKQMELYESKTSAGMFL